MRLQDKFKVGSWLTGNTNKEFRWGTWDCNTFFIELHDMIYNTDDLTRVAEQYSNRSGAIRFLKGLGLSPGQWLAIRSYKKHSGIPNKWKDGDVALVEHRRYASVYFYFNGAFWTVPEGEKLQGYTPASVENAMTSWWRKDG